MSRLSLAHAEVSVAFDLTRFPPLHNSARVVYRGVADVFSKWVTELSRLLAVYGSA